MIRAVLLLVVSTSIPTCVESVGCVDRPAAALSSPPAAPPTLSSASLPAPEPAPVAVAVPVRTEEASVPGDLAAIVVRGGRPNGLQMLFLAGMCTHPGGYVTSFQNAAASRGDLVAVQGDVSCGGEGANRRWSNDLAAMDRRIDAAFVASGLGEPREVVVIGYSQGAERAERLVARWPTKYSSAILMGSPVRPSPTNLRRARAAVLMAGTLDPWARAQSKSAVASLEQAVPVTFIDIPGARHGQMGFEPERTMDDALDFVEERLRPLDSWAPPSNR